jgi:chemotaxis protein CheZ
MDFPEFDADAVSEVTPQEAATRAQKEVLGRVGQMTRALHDNLRGLGFDKLVERAANDIPDARDRLDYVARMSEKAAQRVLNATEAATPLQEGIETGASAIAADWQALMEDGLSEEKVRALARRTVIYLDETAGASAATKRHLMDIMLAQDFQDLTGQVIKKVTELAQNLEQQLLQLLVDYAPAEIKRDVNQSLMNGPQINPEGNSEVVANQSQVDDLLDSLGF